jgi:hypothetical protein|tara:strand:- start:1106 stop:1456 length:351 start_codon:yes stop_codon:yes gene_type:complete
MAHEATKRTKQNERKTMLHTNEPTNTTITHEDSPYIMSAKLAVEEGRAIVEGFQLDFGFSLNDLPSLDVPLSVYEDELELIAMHEERPHWDDSTDCFDRISSEDKKMYTEGFVRMF